MPVDLWARLRGFDETYIGWGSEDQDLYRRVQMAKANITWMGEGTKEIKLMHQPHARDVKSDLAAQDINKKLLLKIDRCRVNDKSWGGISD
jgi:hypothetical protein